MANPTLPAREKRMDFDGLHYEVSGIIVNDKVVGAAQQSNVADAGAVTAVNNVITYSANTPTPADTQTIADGTVPTVAELGQFTANSEDFQAQVVVDLGVLRTKVNAILAVLEAHGLMADA